MATSVDFEWWDNQDSPGRMAQNVPINFDSPGGHDYCGRANDEFKLP
jgi:hypothetical protein